MEKLKLPYPFYLLTQDESDILEQLNIKPFPIPLTTQERTTQLKRGERVVRLENSVFIARLKEGRKGVWHIIEDNDMNRGEDVLFPRDRYYSPLPLILLFAFILNNNDKVSDKVIVDGMKWVSQFNLIMQTAFDNAIKDVRDTLSIGDAIFSDRNEIGRSEYNFSAEYKNVQFAVEEENSTITYGGLKINFALSVDLINKSVGIGIGTVRVKRTDGGFETMGSNYPPYHPHISSSRICMGNLNLEIVSLKHTVEAELLKAKTRKDLIELFSKFFIQILTIGRLAIGNYYPGDCYISVNEIVRYWENQSSHPYDIKVARYNPEPEAKNEEENINIEELNEEAPF